jgi:hypothetical protein
VRTPREAASKNRFPIKHNMALAGEYMHTTNLRKFWRMQEEATLK